MTGPSREALTRRIRDSVSIVDLIGSYVSLRPAGANFKGLCPFHQEKTPSFHVHPAKQIFKCFGCGVGGDVFTFLQLREKVDFLQAREMLAERAGIPLEQERRGGGGGPGKVDLARVNQWAAGFFRRQYAAHAGQSARDYVARRSISSELAEAFALGFAADSFDTLQRAARQAGYADSLLAAAGLVRPSQRGGYYDTFRHRLMFPIVDATDRVIGFGGRTLGDDSAKYINTPETPLFNKGHGVFGLHRARQAIVERKRAIVMEGYTDCIMAHQHGFAETVATLGTAFTSEQAQLLRRYADTVYLVFDSDEAGQQAADRALSVSLLQNLDVRLARVPAGKDPCDFLISHGAEEFGRLLIDARPALEFKWLQVAGRYQDAETGPARRRAIQEFIEQVATWVNAGAVDVIQRGLVVNQIAKLLSVPSTDVHERLLALQRRGTRVTPKQASQKAAPPPPAPPDAVPIAVRELLEVVMNAPRFLDDRVRETLARHTSGDPLLRRVCAAVLGWYDEGQEKGEWRLDELIGRDPDPAIAQIVTDMQATGERRGNYEATAQGALRCIEEAERRMLAASAGEAARRGADREAEDEALRAVTASAKAHRHFSPLSFAPRPG